MAADGEAAPEDELAGVWDSLWSTAIGLRPARALGEGPAHAVTTEFEKRTQRSCTPHRAGAFPDHVEPDLRVDFAEVADDGSNGQEPGATR